MESVFEARLADVKLESLIPKMKEKGWCTYGSFAYASVKKSR